MVMATLLLLSLAATSWAQAPSSTEEKVKQAKERAARDYIQSGLILATENRYEQAVKSFQQALAQDPQNAEALSLLGSTYAKLGKYREAEEALRKAVALKPNYAEGYYYLGVFLEEQGKKQEAQEAFRKARGGR
jgi:Tfp pilus assembly protein PilF